MMRMGSLVISLVLVSAGFLCGCTEQVGVEVDDTVEGTDYSVLISRIEVMNPYGSEELYIDSVATVLVYASNVGPEVATEDFYFSIDGMIKQMKRISFRPGENQVFSFSTACSDCPGGHSYFSEVGEYRIAVNDFETTVDIVELPVLLMVESIEWHATGPEENLQYIPNLIVYVVNTGDNVFPVDYWELVVDGELVTDIVRTDLSTINELAPYAEGRVVLEPKGVYALDENGLDITLSELRLRDIPTDEQSGEIRGLVRI